MLYYTFNGWKSAGSQDMTQRHVQVRVHQGLRGVSAQEGKTHGAAT
jgi:hypothetical protein